MTNCIYVKLSTAKQTTIAQQKATHRKVNNLLKSVSVFTRKLADSLFFICVVVTWYLFFINTKGRSLIKVFAAPGAEDAIVVVHQSAGGKHCGSLAEEHKASKWEIQSF